jgi:serine/threonine protein kinase
LKAIPNSQSRNPEEFQIGLEIGKKCEYLVKYDGIFTKGDFKIIIMDYFEKGDLQSYLSKRNQLKESVYISFISYFFFFVINRK